MDMRRLWLDHVSKSQSSKTICRQNNNMRWEPAAWPIAALGKGVVSSGDCVLCWLQYWWASVCHCSCELQHRAAGIPDYLIACKSSLKLPIHHKSYGEYQFQSERWREKETERCLELWWAISDVKRLWIVKVSFLCEISGIYHMDGCCCVTILSKF